MIILYFVINESSPDLDQDEKILHYSISGAFPGNLGNPREKEAGLYSLLGLLEIADNDGYRQCVADDLRKGVCMRSKTCEKEGGKASGSCSLGFETCCVFEVTCGGEVNRKNSIIVSPNYPNSFLDSGRCDVRIKRPSPDIVQVRLDFVEFVLQQPTLTVCKKDQFVVLGFPNIPIICGVNTGQHMYIDFPEIDEIPLIFMTSVAENQRLWNIRVTYIKNESPLRAPNGCLQYHTGVTGRSSSFNFDGPASDISRHLANQNYAVCVRQETGYCSIRWTAETFELSRNVNEGKAKQGPFCQGDYVLILESSAVGGTVMHDRFCGTRLNTQLDATENVPLTSSATPFLLQMSTDGEEIAGTLNRGFSMTYDQLPCGS
ncbi:uncharacterized protein LOC143251747 [Tachypleus tridentatus]|uniref:uncharacterized protein LOC143251747 n=1 Tax=Tachypleus tridentatus TaxID=6853 RepID=UPI003FD45D15